MNFLFFFFLMFCGPSFAGSVASLRQSTAPIMVVFPKEGELIGPASAQFVLGSVSDPQGVFEINGATVSIYKTGAFLAWVPIHSGTFTFHCDLKSGGVSSSFERHVLVKPWPAPLPMRPIAIDHASISPSVDEELNPGDWLVVRFKGSPGGKAWFRLAHHSWMKMREYDHSMGLYEGLYRVTPQDDMKSAPIELYLSSLKMETRAKVSFYSGAPKIAVVKGQDPVLLRAEPDTGEMFPIYPAVRVVTGERKGGWTRLNFPNGQSGWIQTSDLDFLPMDSSPPSAETGFVTVKALKDESVVRLGLSARVPFEMEESSDLSHLTVLIYYAHIHTNWILYQDPSFVNQVRIRQKARGLVELTIDLKKGRHIWGYHASFEGNSLSIELRHPPMIAHQALQGRTVFLDPGHMPSAPGAIGGLGTKEMEVNLAIAKVVAKLLKKEGANVVLSHEDDIEEVGLAARPRLAWESRADVFVSIHNNNVATGENPFKAEHGYQIFYYQPESLALARAVHHSYKKFVPLLDEGMRYGNYLVIRMPEMPAILTESAYLSYPAQEALLLDPAFQMKAARSIVSGLRSFFESQGVKKPKKTFSPKPVKKNKPHSKLRNRKNRKRKKHVRKS